MGKHLDWLTVELEKASTRVSLGYPVDQVVEEVRCHVVSSQEALIELGLSPEAAEEEAVSRFGSAKEYVKSLSVLYKPRTDSYDLPTLILTFLATVFTIVFICLQEARTPVLWVGWGIFGAFILRRMWQVRRIQWAVAWIFVPASVILGFAYPLMWGNPNHEAMGHWRLSGTREYRASLTATVSSYDDALAELSRLKGETGLIVPSPIQFAPGRVIVRTRTYPTLAEADAVRKRVIPSFEGSILERRAEALGQLSTMEQVLSQPFWHRLLLDFKIGPYFGLGWTVLMLAANLCVVFLRSLYDRGRRVLGLA